MPAPRNVLLTGAAGGVGTQMRSLLPGYGYALRLFDVVPIEDEPGAVTADLADRAALRRAVTGVDAIIHLAGISLESTFEKILRANVEGTYNLYEAAREAGVPCALVTMSYQAFAEAVVVQGPPDAFDVVVTGDEVEHPKPHPEPYLKAARELGVDIRRCVAIEDSRPGVASALASGARTLAVQHIVPVDAQDGLSRVGSLAGVDLADLARIAAGRNARRTDRR